MTRNNPAFQQADCEFNRPFWYYYESIRINVIQSGTYTFSIISQSFFIKISWHKKHFNSCIDDGQILDFNENNCPGTGKSHKLIAELQPNMTYILVVASHLSPDIAKFSVLSFGPNRIILNEIRKCDILVCFE
mgnify:FL=1